jgi:ribosomal protein S18 acetylase RimI-like enzyme
VSEVPVWPASPSEADVVGRLLFDFNTEFQTPTPDAAAFADRFRTLLGRDDVLVVLAGSSTDPAGFAFLTLRPTPYYDGPLAQLEELYVRPDLRDRGIGTRLLLESIRLVRAAGAEEMQINVDEVDADTRRFYERHGFYNVEPGEDYRMLCYIQEFD